MGDVIVSFTRANARARARRDYRAIGVDAAAVACVRRAFEGHADLLAAREIDDPVGEHALREDIPLGLTRPLYPSTAEFFREWDRRRVSPSAWVVWADLPSGVDLTPGGCLQIPETRQLGFAHSLWEIEMGKHWPQVEAALWNRLSDPPDGVRQKAFRLPGDRILIFIGPKITRKSNPLRWGDSFKARVCLQREDEATPRHIH
jgi:hypothetical protein